MAGSSTKDNPFIRDRTRIQAVDANNVTFEELYEIKNSISDYKEKFKSVSATSLERQLDGFLRNAEEDVAIASVLLVVGDKPNVITALSGIHQSHPEKVREMLKASTYFDECTEYQSLWKVLLRALIGHKDTKKIFNRGLADKEFTEYLLSQNVLHLVLQYATELHHAVALANEQTNDTLDKELKVKAQGRDLENVDPEQVAIFADRTLTIPNFTDSDRLLGVLKKMKKLHKFGKKERDNIKDTLKEHRKHIQEWAESVDNESLKTAHQLLLLSKTEDPMKGVKNLELWKTHILHTTQLAVKNSQSWFNNSEKKMLERYKRDEKDREHAKRYMSSALEDESHLRKYNQKELELLRSVMGSDMSLQGTERLRKLDQEQKEKDDTKAQLTPTWGERSGVAELPNASQLKDTMERFSEEIYQKELNRDKYYSCAVELWNKKNAQQKRIENREKSFKQICQDIKHVGFNLDKCQTTCKDAKSIHFAYTVYDVDEGGCKKAALELSALERRPAGWGDTRVAVPSRFKRLIPEVKVFKVSYESVKDYIDVMSGYHTTPGYTNVQSRQKILREELPVFADYAEVYDEASEDAKRGFVRPAYLFKTKNGTDMSNDHLRHLDDMVNVEIEYMSGSPSLYWVWTKVRGAMPTVFQGALASGAILGMHAPKLMNTTSDLIKSAALMSTAFAPGKAETMIYAAITALFGVWYNPLFWGIAGAMKRSGSKVFRSKGSWARKMALHYVQLQEAAHAWGLREQDQFIPAVALYKVRHQKVAVENHFRLAQDRRLKRESIVEKIESDAVKKIYQQLGSIIDDSVVADIMQYAEALKHPTKHEYVDAVKNGVSGLAKGILVQLLTELPSNVQEQETNIRGKVDKIDKDMRQRVEKELTQRRAEIHLQRHINITDAPESKASKASFAIALHNVDASYSLDRPEWRVLRYEHSKGNWSQAPVFKALIGILDEHKTKTAGIVDEIKTLSDRAKPQVDIHSYLPMTIDPAEDALDKVVERVIDTCEARRYGYIRNALDMLSSNMQDQAVRTSPAYGAMQEAIDKHVEHASRPLCEALDALETLVSRIKPPHAFGGTRKQKEDDKVEYDWEPGFEDGFKNNRLVISKGSVVKFKGDAIVNAANETCLGGGGLDGAITHHGERDLRTARRMLPIIETVEKEGKVLKIRCPTGDAKITTGGKLQRNGIKYVIHAVGPDYQVKYEKPHDELLRDAYTRSMEIVRDENIQSVAFPLLSAGLFGGEVTHVAKIAFETIADFLDTNGTSVRVHLVAYTENEFNALVTASRAYERKDQFRQRKRPAAEQAAPADAGTDTGAKPADTGTGTGKGAQAHTGAGTGTQAHTGAGTGAQAEPKDRRPAFHLSGHYTESELEALSAASAQSQGARSQEADAETAQADTARADTPTGATDAHTGAPTGAEQTGAPTGAEQTGASQNADVPVSGASARQNQAEQATERAGNQEDARKKLETLEKQARAILHDVLRDRLLSTPSVERPAARETEKPKAVVKEANGEDGKGGDREGRKHRVDMEDGKGRGDGDVEKGGNRGNRGNRGKGGKHREGREDGEEKNKREDGNGGEDVEAADVKKGKGGNRGNRGKGTPEVRPRREGKRTEGEVSPDEGEKKPRRRTRNTAEDVEEADRISTAGATKKAKRSKTPEWKFIVHDHNKYEGTIPTYDLSTVSKEYTESGGWKVPHLQTKSFVDEGNFLKSEQEHRIVKKVSMAKNGSTLAEWIPLTEFRDFQNAYALYGWPQNRFHEIRKAWSARSEGERLVDVMKRQIENELNRLAASIETEDKAEFCIISDNTDSGVIKVPLYKEGSQRYRCKGTDINVLMLNGQRICCTKDSLSESGVPKTQVKLHDLEIDRLHLYNEDLKRKPFDQRPEQGQIYIKSALGAGEDAHAYKLVAAESYDKMLEAKIEQDGLANRKEGQSYRDWIKAADNKQNKTAYEHWCKETLVDFGTACKDVRQFGGPFGDLAPGVSSDPRVVPKDDLGAEKSAPFGNANKSASEGTVPAEASASTPGPASAQGSFAFPSVPAGSSTGAAVPSKPASAQEDRSELPDAKSPKTSDPKPAPKAQPENVEKAITVEEAGEKVEEALPDDTYSEEKCAGTQMTVKLVRRIGKIQAAINEKQKQVRTEPQSVHFGRMIV